MKKIVRISEEQLTTLINRVVVEQDNIDEGIFDPITDFTTGIKGAKRGYGYDYFTHVSKLNRIVNKLKKLDLPNERVINELNSLHGKVSSLNIPKDRKDELIKNIGQTLQTWEWYTTSKETIIKQIESLNLKSWK